MTRSLFIALVLAAASFSPTTPCLAQTPPQPGEIITLNEKLQKLLKVTRAEEQEFLDRVLEAVQKLELTEQLVLSVTFKAIRYNEAYPYPYFRVMMTKIANARGIPLL